MNSACMRSYFTQRIEIKNQLQLIMIIIFITKINYRNNFSKLIIIVIHLHTRELVGYNCFTYTRIFKFPLYIV